MSGDDDIRQAFAEAPVAASEPRALSPLPDGAALPASVELNQPQAKYTLEEMISTFAALSGEINSGRIKGVIFDIVNSGFDQIDQNRCLDILRLKSKAKKIRYRPGCPRLEEAAAG